MLEIKVEKVNESAQLPTKAFKTDSGFDIYANETVVIPYGERVYIPTGIKLQLPEGYGARIKGRSGLTGKTKLTIHEGTIDNGYRGEVKVIAENCKHKQGIWVFIWKQLHLEGVLPLMPYKDQGSITINKGDRIAQLILEVVPDAKIIEVDQVDQADRGGNGFGSTGL